MCFGYRGEYRVVYVTPEYIDGDGCELFKQLHSKVGMLTMKMDYLLYLSCVLYFKILLFLGRLRVDLIQSVSDVHPPVRTSVRLSTKSFFDFNEVWYVGRGRRVMHDGMQYQGQGHELLKVGNSAIFKGYLLPHL